MTCVFPRRHRRRSLFAVCRTDASFDYVDPTSMVLVQSLRAGSPSLELNFRGAMGHLLTAMHLAPDAA